MFLLSSKLVQCCPNLSIVVQISQMLSRLVQLCLDWSNVVQTGLIWSKLVQMGSKLSKLLQGGLNWSNVGQIGPMGSKSVLYAPIWFKVVQHDPNGSKWSNMVKVVLSSPRSKMPVILLFLVFKQSKMRYTASVKKIFKILWTLIETQLGFGTAGNSLVFKL